MTELDRINKRIAELAARRLQLEKKEKLKEDRKEAAQKQIERKLRNRRISVLGAWILGHRPDMLAEVVGQLTRDSDRALFLGKLSTPFLLPSELPVICQLTPSGPKDHP